MRRPSMWWRCWLLYQVVWSHIVWESVVVGVLGLLTSPVQAADYSVMVGYADRERADSANFPTPWAGSPGVLFQGCSRCQELDAGAIRIVNNTAGTLTVNAVVVRLDTCIFNIWPANMAVPFGGELILTQTIDQAASGCGLDGRFDTSDVGPNSTDWSGVCTNSSIFPEIDVTVNGVTTTFVDTGQVLNTGGIDKSDCPDGTNESTQWTVIGSPPCPSAVLTLTPGTQTPQVGTTVTVSATLTNSCGTPLAGVDITFAIMGGPNIGTTHIDTTDKNGTASFSYTSTGSGTDTVQATVVTVVGTFSSPSVSVPWTAPASSPATSTSPPSAAAPATQGGGGGGCSLRPGEEGAPAAYGTILGNIALPLVVLLVLRVWSWRRQG